MEEFWEGDVVGLDVVFRTYLVGIFTLVGPGGL